MKKKVVSGQERKVVSLEEKKREIEKWVENHRAKILNLSPQELLDDRVGFVMDL